MTRRRILAGMVTALFAPIASLRAHPNYRIIGTLEKVTATTIAVRQTRDGRIIGMDMDNESRVTRDKKDVDRSALKAGLPVVVDACGDSLDDLLVMEIRLVAVAAKKSVVAVLCLVVLSSLAIAAQGADADLKEIHSYRLTAPAMKQVATTTRLMIAAAKDDAEVAKKLQGSVSNLIGKSLSDIERAIEQEPLAAAALKKAGLTAREYAKFMVVFFQSSMTHNMQKSGAIKELPATANPDNLKFVEAHQAEFMALMSEFQALAKPKLE